MLRCGRGLQMAELVVSSRICCGHLRQFAVQPVICRTLRCGSTVAGFNEYDTAAQKATVEHFPVPWNRVIYASDPVSEKHVSESLFVYEDFISEDEERSLFDEVEPYLKRLKYEHDHWDDVSIFTDWLDRCYFLVHTGGNMSMSMSVVDLYSA